MKLSFVLASAAPGLAGSAEGHDESGVPPAGADDDEVAAVCAGALSRLGHAVCALGAGSRPPWLPAPLSYADLLAMPGSFARQDLLLTASWRSIQAARSLRAGPVSHLCHRFEGELAVSDRMAGAIDRAYSMVPAGLATSPRLAEFLEHRFGRTSHVVTLPPEPGFRPRFRVRPRRVPRILVAGCEEDSPGLKVVAAVAGRLLPQAASAGSAEAGRPLFLLSPAANAGEPATVGVWPRAAYAAALRRCDLALLAQHAPILRLLQCAASGVPTVVLDGGPCADLARRARLEAPAPDGQTLFLQAEALLRSGAAWRSARREGVALGRGLREPPAAEYLERAIGELARGLD